MLIYLNKRQQKTGRVNKTIFVNCQFISLYHAISSVYEIVSGRIASTRNSSNRFFKGRRRSIGFMWRYNKLINWISRHGDRREWIQMGGKREKKRKMTVAATLTKILRWPKETEVTKNQSFLTCHAKYLSLFHWSLLLLKQSLKSL